MLRHAFPSTAPKSSAPRQQLALSLLTTAVVFSVGGPAMAQQSPGFRSQPPVNNSSTRPASSVQPAPAQSQLTPRQARQFVAVFNRNITDGCLKNPPANVLNPQNYCSCYASAFTKRYEVGELITINAVAAKSKLGLDVITLMMAPDRRLCAK